MKLDFDKINSALLSQHINFLNTILPGGKVEGSQYVVLNPTRVDNTLGSFKIHISKGIWKDFSTNDSGSDPISLYAYINGLSQFDAAKELAKEYNIMPMNNKTKKKKEEENKLIQIIPVPEDASKPPIAHPRLGKYNKGWAYRDINGRLMGYVVRFDTGEGRKEFYPLTFRKDEKGNCRWHWKSFDKPRPLYGLNLLKKYPDSQVLMVEGEECAYEGHKLFPIPVTTWEGGTNSTSYIDVLPLKGRKVILFPDADKKKYPKNHKRVGEVMDMEEQPGFKAMMDIYRQIKKFCKVKIVVPAPNKPDTWDIVDAINEGWTKKQIIAYIKKNTADPETFLKKKKAEHFSLEYFSLEIFKKAPFRCLGFDHLYFHYLNNKSRQVVAFNSNNHTKLNLLSIAPFSWWYKHFSAKGRNVDWEIAANNLFRMAENVGFYDSFSVRGCGAWFDEGQIVLHLGNYLLVNGIKTQIARFDTKYIYEYAKPIELIDAEPLKKEETHKLIQITDLLSWENPVYSRLFAGWCVVASICGALYWRPHLWITGSAGTGKSWIMENIIRPTLGDAALIVNSNTTEAAIRQALGNNAFSVLHDEAADVVSQEKIQGILELMRQASLEGSGEIMKGTQSGKAMRFRIRSCFCLAGVNIKLRQQADISRVSILTLTKHKIEERENRFNEIRKVTSDLLSKEWCAGLRARSIKMIPIIRKNADTFAQAFSELYSERRMGDQVGTLLSGAYSLYSDTEITHQDAVDWIRDKDWTENISEESESDEKKCLLHLLQHQISIISDNRRFDCSMGTLIGIAAGIKEVKEDNLEINIDDAKTNILRNGIKIGLNSSNLPIEVIISNNHSGIQEIYRNTMWSGGWTRSLLRLPNSLKKNTCRFELGSRTRAVGIPLSLIFD